MDYIGKAAPESEGGIIIDFHTVKWLFRNYLDETYDHRIALDKHDPLLKGLNTEEIHQRYPGYVLCSIQKIGRASCRERVSCCV